MSFRDPLSFQGRNTHTHTHTNTHIYQPLFESAHQCVRPVSVHYCLRPSHANPPATNPSRPIHPPMSIATRVLPLLLQIRSNLSTQDNNWGWPSRGPRFVRLRPKSCPPHTRDCRRYCFVPGTGGKATTICWGPPLLSPFGVGQ